MRPIAFASEAFSSNERIANKSATEKELAAITYGVKHFKQYLYGSKFTVTSDHACLRYIDSMVNSNEKIQKMRNDLSSFDFTVVYRKGRDCQAVDALSRMFLTEILETHDADYIEMSCFSARLEPKNFLKANLYATLVEVVSEEDKKKLMTEFHFNALHGQRRFQIVIDKIKVHGYTWPGMYTDIRKFVQSCESCQTNNHSNRHTKFPMEITDSPSHPMSKLSLDIVGPMPMTELGNVYVLSVIDHFTRYAWTIPLKTIDATVVADALMTNVFLQVGFCDRILSDRGSNFLSKIFLRFCELLDIEKISSTAYSHATLGIVEKFHDEMKTHLRKFIDEKQTNWDVKLPYATHCHNITEHSSLKTSPFHLFYVRKPKTPSVFECKAERIDYADVDDYLERVVKRMREAAVAAVSSSDNSKFKNKIHYDKRVNPVDFTPNEQVMIIAENVRRGRSAKLDKQYLGPYRVVKKVDNVNYEIVMNGHKQTVHGNRLKKFYEY